MTLSIRCYSSTISNVPASSKPNTSRLAASMNCAPCSPSRASLNVFGTWRSLASCRAAGEKGASREELRRHPSAWRVTTQGRAALPVPTAQATNSYPCSPPRPWCRMAVHLCSPPRPPTPHAACLRPPALQIRAPAGALVSRSQSPPVGQERQQHIIPRMR